MNHPRGTVLIVSAGSGLSRKPRPMVVVQDSQIEFPETLLVVPLSAQMRGENILIPKLQPDAGNGLQSVSSAMTNRVGPIRKSDIGQVAGKLAEVDIEQIDLALQTIFGFNTN